MTVRCSWCEAPMSPRRGGGLAKLYCSDGCRRATQVAARSWALAELAAGRITVAAIKAAVASSVQKGRRDGRAISNRSSFEPDARVALDDIIAAKSDRIAAAQDVDVEVVRELFSRWRGELGDAVFRDVLNAPQSAASPLVAVRDAVAAARARRASA